MTALNTQCIKPLLNPKTVEIDGKTFRVGEIPCIPGMDLFTECSSVVDAVEWKDIDTKALRKLAAYAEVEVEGVTQRLNSDNACLAFCTTKQLWLVCLEVYAHSFGFFLNGGTPAVMSPLLNVKKQQSEEAESNTGT